jgi:methyl-accepting chemotaxis protein
MEAVTQQNAALVEETTGATLSFEEQATRLAAAVSRFKLPGSAALLARLARDTFPRVEKAPPAIIGA